MLEFIRNRAQSWVAWVIVGLIIIPFALFGIGDYATNDAGNNVATVNDVKISNQEFQRAYYQQEQRMKEMLGADFDVSVFEGQMRKNVLDGIVEQELLVQVSRDEGLRVSAQQLAMIIQGIEAFQSDGKFDRETYLSALNMQGQSIGYFESRIHRSLLSQQLYAAVASSSVVSNSSIDTYLRLQNQQRDIGYFEIPAAKFSADISIDESAASDYYNENSNLYKTTETVDVEYVSLSLDDLIDGIELSEQEIVEAFAEQKSSMTPAEQRKASHILVELQPGAEKDEVGDASEKARMIKLRLVAGEDFSSLAQEFSDDLGSADMGGDLGFFSQGDMAPEFDEKVFSMSQGDVSDVVETEFGFHIIRLDEIKASKEPLLADVRDQLVEQLRFNKAESKYYDLVDSLTNLAFEYPDSLEVVAEDLSLSIATYKEVSKSSGEGFLANPKVLSVLFSADVLGERLNSEPIEVADNHVIVMRVDSHEQAKTRSFSDVEQSIVAQLTTKASRYAAQELGEEVLIKIQAGVDTDALEVEYGITWILLDGQLRGSRELDSAIVSRAFELPRPKEGGLSAGSVALASGDYAVVSVSSVRDLALIDITAKQRMAARARLLGLQGDSEYAAFSVGLKSVANIALNLE